MALIPTMLLSSLLLPLVELAFATPVDIPKNVPAHARNQQASPRCQLLGRIVPMVEEFAGVPFRSPIRCIELADREFEQRISAQYVSEHQALDSLGRGMQNLGVIPRAFDFHRCVTLGFAQHVAGAYERSSRSLLLRGSTPELVIAHELLHALRDQYNLLPNGQGLTFDSASAVSAVVEGDAMIAEEALAGRLSGEEVADEKSPPKATEKTTGKAPEESTEQALDCALPQSLAYLFEFPYTFGKFFIAEQRRVGGNEALLKVLQRPPSSTSEILWGAGARKECPQPSGTTKRKTVSRSITESLGEYGIRTLLREHLGSAAALKGARGWCGDTFFLNGDLVELQVVWSKEEEAREFIQAYKKVIQHRFGVAVEERPTRFTVETTSQGARVYISASQEGSVTTVRSRVE